MAKIHARYTAITVWFPFEVLCLCWPIIQTRWVMPKCFGYRASIYYLTSDNNFMVVSLAVSAILGGCNPPLDASKLSKRADAINHYTPQNLTHPLIFLKGNSLSYKLLITDSSKYVTKTTKLAKLSFVPATTTACSQDSYVYNKNSIRSCHHTNFMKKYSEISRKLWNHLP